MGKGFRWRQDFRVWRSVSPACRLIKTADRLQPTVLVHRAQQHGSLRSSIAPRISSKRESSGSDIINNFVDY